MEKYCMQDSNMRMDWQRHYKLLLLFLFILIFLLVEGTILCNRITHDTETVFVSDGADYSSLFSMVSNADVSVDQVVLKSGDEFALVGILLPNDGYDNYNISFNIDYLGTESAQLSVDLYNNDKGFDDPTHQVEKKIDFNTSQVNLSLSTKGDCPDIMYIRIFGVLPADATITHINITSIGQSMLYPILSQTLTAGAILASCLFVFVFVLWLIKKPNEFSANPNLRRSAYAATPLTRMQTMWLDLCLWITLAFFLIYMIINICNHTILFADGSYGVVGQLLLSPKELIFNQFTLSFTNRPIANLLSSFFVIVIKALGCNSVPVIIAAYSVGHMFWSFLFFGITLFLCRRTKNLFIMTMTMITSCFSLFFTGFFLCIESLLLCSAYWLILTYVLVFAKEVRSMGIKIVILITATLFTMIHEFSSVMGLLLVVVIIIQFIRGKIDGKVYWTAVSVLLLVSSVIGWKGIINARDPGTKTQFLSTIHNIDIRILVICILMLIIFLLSLFVFSRNGKNQTVFYVVIALEAFISLILLTYAIFDYQAIAYGSYNARMLNFVFPFAMTIWVCLVCIGRVRMPNHLFVPEAIGFIAAVLVFTVLSSVTYNVYLGKLANICRANEGIHETSEYNELIDSYNWGWSITCESILAQVLYGDSRIITGTVSPDFGWEPFDSENADAYPNLSEYGIKYDLDTSQ